MRPPNSDAIALSKDDIDSTVVPAQGIIQSKGEVGTMTKLLEKALREASKLPAREQNAFAKIMLEELTSERKWTRQFAKSQHKLATLADEALLEHAQGKTMPLGKATHTIAEQAGETT
jgi:hypothetical protein